MRDDMHNGKLPIARSCCGDFSEMHPLYEASCEYLMIVKGKVLCTRRVIDLQCAWVEHFLSLQSQIHCHSARRYFIFLPIFILRFPSQTSVLNHPSSSQVACFLPHVSAIMANNTPTQSVTLVCVDLGDNRLIFVQKAYLLQ